MNTWATAILWGMLQVTLLSTFGVLLYMAARRRGPAAGALASIGTLLAVLFVTALSVVPLPANWTTGAAWSRLAENWTGNESPVPEATAQRDVESMGEATPEIQRPKEADSTFIADFWGAFVDEMRRAPVEQSGAPRRWPLAVLALFGVGAAFGLFRLVAGATAVRSYRRHSRPIADAMLYRLTETLREENGCRRDVEIRETGKLSTPATVGCFKPIVLLPEGWREWSRDELRAVLAHEIAHVARGDYLSGLLAQVTVAIHFYHPLVHWLVARLRLEQELAADASGMRISGGRDVYLVTLAGMALRQDDLAVSWAARPFLPTRGTFMRRIEMLRDSRKQANATLPRGGRAVLIGAVALAALAVAGLRPGENGIALAQQPVAAPAASSGTLPLTGVSPDVQVFMAIRPATILAKPELASFAKQLSELFAKDGVKVEQLDFVSISIIGEGNAQNERFVLRSTVDTDWKELIAGLPYAASAKQVSLGRHQFTLFENDPGKRTVFVIDSRTIMIQSEKSLKSYLAWADSIKSQDAVERPKWAPLWDKVNTAHAAVAFDPAIIRPKLEKATIDQLGPIFGFAPLWKDTEAAVLGIDLGDGMKIEGYASAANADGAARIARTLDAAKAMFLNFEPMMREQVMSLPTEIADINLKALDAGAQIVNSAQVTANAATVELKAEGPADTAVTVAILAPALQQARAAARRVQSSNNLKQLGLAMFNYESTYTNFPPAVGIGPDGKTPVSWRVAILPFIGEDALYRQYNLNEPWDSENNKKVLAQMPAVYRHPSDDSGQPYSSYYVFTGEAALFNGSNGAKLASVHDGLSNTLMIVEAKRDIPWTKPEDIPFDPSQPLPQLGGFNPEGFNVGFADGSVRFMSNAVDSNILKALTTAKGGETVAPESYTPHATPQQTK